MNAFPMLRRCFQAQWWGLDEADRVRLNAAWARASLNTQLLHRTAVDQVETPIWQAMAPTTWLTLLSVKDDFVP